MLKLCGFTASNYHNKVKLALLEKNIVIRSLACNARHELGANVHAVLQHAIVRLKGYIWLFAAADL